MAMADGLDAATVETIHQVCEEGIATQPLACVLCGMCLISATFTLVVLLGGPFTGSKACCFEEDELCLSVSLRHLFHLAICARLCLESGLSLSRPCFICFTICFRLSGS
jgi:hypothetical protein